MSTPFKITEVSPNVPYAAFLQKPIQQNVSESHVFLWERALWKFSEAGRQWLFLLTVSVADMVSPPSGHPDYDTLP